MKLHRPLVVLDLETTGTDIRTDRIVDIALVTLHPDGRRDSWSALVDPLIQIPPASTAVHGITDEVIAGAPPFADLIPTISARLEGADVGGFNVRRFDWPLLAREYERAGATLPVIGSIVDAQEVYHHHEPRDLAACSRRYLGVEHTRAHRAEADAAVTLEILRMQSAAHAMTVEQMATIRRPANAVDAEGKLLWREGLACFSFGKHIGHSLQWVAKRDPSFLAWVQRADFSREVKDLCARALAGQFPETR